MTVSVTIAPLAIQQFFNNQGLPNAGGSILTQVGGSNYATYQDSGGTTPLPNPIPLNSRGEISNASGLSCQLFLQQGVVYTFTFYDANGNQYDQATYVTTPAAITQSSVGLLLYPQSPAEIAAGVVPTSYNFPWGNVLRYGADNTGITASDVAFRQAILVGCTASSTSGYGNHTAVYIPAGLYQLTTTNVFGNPLQTTVGPIRGLLIYGDGMGGTQITLNTNGGTNTLWLFDGTGTEGPSGTNPEVQNWIDLTVRDLYFKGDVAVIAGVYSTASGFQGYTSQGLKFVRVSLNDFNVGYECNPQAGNVGFGGDSWTWMDCHEVNMSGAVIQLNNSQALNWQRTACRSETIYGDCVRVNVGGGGAFRWIGGSIITQGGTAQTYLLNIQPNANIADNNNTFYFEGIQTEAHVATACLVYCGGGQAQGPNITFKVCNFTETNGARTSVSNLQGDILFERCVMTSNQGSSYTCTGPASGGAQYGVPARIKFFQCEVPINLWSFCSTPASADSLVWGSISAEECTWANFDSTVSRFLRYAVDFDMNTFNQGRAGIQPRLKTAIGYIQNYAMPAASGSTSTWTLNLPGVGQLVRVFASRIATSNAASYNLTISAGGSSLATVTGTNTNASQTIVWDQLSTPAPQAWLNLASGTNSVVTLSTTATVNDIESGSGPGNYFFAQYY